MRTVDPLIVSNNILLLAKEDGIPVTPMKLQKLLYFLYRDYLKRTGEHLFADRFEAWKYGPVLSEVYYAFNEYRDKPIKKYYQDGDGNYYKVNETNNPAFKNVLYEVWNKYKDYNGIELSSITHQKGTAWRKAWNADKPFLDDDDIMSEED